jgi:hypothetical protein
MGKTRFLCALFLALLVSGCTDGSTTGESAVCVPGKSDPCTCTAGQSGAQKCKDDGSGFEECVCGAQPTDVLEGAEVPSRTDSGDVGDQTGFCSPACLEGSCCSGSCVDMSGDEANCGTCGKHCQEGQSCVAGKCVECTADCTAKECGDDGCGGGCGSCTGDEVCQVTQCEACVPNCDAKACGDDGCGGSCGVCTEPAVCVSGNCTTDCAPNCSGLLCGDPDGCGEKCDGACPGGGSCSNRVCVGDCKPSCEGKECGNDGCGGQCGACDWPESCGAGGQCKCTSLCSIEGRQCGADGCGGSCGTCVEGESCADASSPAVIPTFLCLNLASGCSDGTREGFASAAVFPEIASCEGAFSPQSLRATRTGAWCGNSLGYCQVPEDLCAPGWHLCMRNGWPGDMKDRIVGEDCASPNAGNGRFVAASQAGAGCFGGCKMETPYPCGDFPAICCGDSCADGWCTDEVWAGLTRLSGAPDCCAICSIFNTCDNMDDITGVLCCKDPPVVGH